MRELLEWLRNKFICWFERERGAEDVIHFTTFALIVLYSLPAYVVFSVAYNLSGWAYLWFLVLSLVFGAIARATWVRVSASWASGGKTDRQRLLEAERSIRADRLHGHLRSERWAEAEATLEEMVGETPDDPQLYAQIAGIRERRGDLSGARDLYRRALRQAEWVGGGTFLVTRLRDELARVERCLVEDLRPGVTRDADDDLAIDLAPAGTPLPSNAARPRATPAFDDEVGIDLVDPQDEDHGVPIPPAGRFPRPRAVRPGAGRPPEPRPPAARPADPDDELFVELGDEDDGSPR